MKSRRRISIAAAAMAAVMMLSSGAVPFTAAAESSVTVQSAEESKALKAALAKVKRRFTIPEHVSEFSYYREYDFSTECFRFNWCTPDNAETDEEYRITIIGDTIVRFSHSTEGSKTDGSSPQFAKLSDEELVKKAKGHLKKLNPHAYAEGVYTLTDIELFGSKAYVQFQRKENGIIVDGNGFDIVIDKNTGELYSVEGCWWDNTEFADTADMLSKDELIKKFKQQCRLTPIYNISYDFNLKKNVGKIVYDPDFYGELDAFSGKKSSVWNDMVKDGGTDENPHGYTYKNTVANGVDTNLEDATNEAGAEEDFFNDVQFTEEELKKLDESTEYLSRAELKKLFTTDPYIKLNENAELKSYELIIYDDTNEAYYDLYYSAEDYSANIYANAKTGKVEFYDTSIEGTLSDKEPYPVESCLEKAKAAAKCFYPEICGEYRSVAENRRKSVCGDNNSYEVIREFEFARYVNGIEVAENSIYVTVANNGQVTDVSSRYYDAEFDPPTEFDKEKAFEELFRQKDIMLYYDGYYKPDGTIKTYLIYNISDFSLNPDYALCYYNGVPIKKTEYESTVYTDISGHRYEKAITTLARYGIILKSENGKFNPDGSITEAEFISLLDGALYGDPYDASGVKSLALTRELAAKVIAEFYGSDLLFYINGIFKQPYSDVTEDNQYIGHISVVKSLGLMSGSGDKFYPKNKITRGAAMQLVYNFLMKYPENEKLLQELARKE
ncbi:MAG: S-layer homology domain-containing protein [Oscillospiraceae bacterium]|nr:S-layer homology domain-containing protein [Oscillospiraceae bacterium]